MTANYDIAVIGGGAAGQMAALRGVLNHLNVLFFLGDANTSRKGRAQWVASVDNIPGFFDSKRPIFTTTKQVVDFVNSKDDLKPFLTTHKKTVDQVRQLEKGFELTAAGETYKAKYIVLCTGTMDVQPEIGGSIKPILPFANKGDVEYCIRCDGHKTYGKATTVIGHKTSAAWIAIMLKERYNLEDISIITHGKESEFDPEVNQILQAYNIPIHQEEITDILGTPKEGLKGFQLGSKSISAQKAFVSLGSIVYNDLAKQVGAKLNERDHLVVNEKFESTVSGFYAAGDLVGGKKKQVYTAWDMAVDAVDDIDSKIRIEKRSKLIL